MSISAVLSWKDLLLLDRARDSSNAFLSKIKAADGPSIPFVDSFEEISKNQGIAILSLEPSKTQLQLFHHGVVLGESWSSPNKQLVSVLGLDSSTKPVQIISKSVRDVKQKTFSFQEFDTSLESSQKFENMKNVKSEFDYKNVIPIPNTLMKFFINFESTDPYSVAKAFFEQMKESDSSSQVSPGNQSKSMLEIKDFEEDQSSPIQNEDNSVTDSRAVLAEKSPCKPFLDFIHVIQFCHLCLKCKIPPVLYTLMSSLDIQ
jgi:hypothetical protein